MCFYALFSFQRVRVYVCKFCGAAALCAWFTCCGSVHLFTICAPDGSPAAALPGLFRLHLCKCTIFKKLCTNFWKV